MNKLYYGSLLVLFLHCSTPIELEVRDTQRLLVVDASLTNETKFHQIRLNFSIPLDSSEPEAVTQANVWVADDTGNRYQFTELEAGVYVSDDQFAVLEGTVYELNLATPDGKSYKSSGEKLPIPVSLDELYGEYVMTPSVDQAGFDEGIRFFISSSADTEEVFNVRIEYEEDYVVVVPYSSPFIYSPGNGINPRDTLIQTCYNKLMSSELLIGSTGGQSENMLVDFPINLVNPTDPQLSLRYALSVRQYSISSEAYTYYQDLKRNNESSGGFFDIQKGSVFGNISNVNEVEEPVLGYFEVAHVDSIRTFFEPAQWREDGFIPEQSFLSCEYSRVADSVLTEDVLRDEVRFGTRNIHAISMDGTYTILVPLQCSDCRLYGTLIKPDFWD